jgi:hypothetical protein
MTLECQYTATSDIAIHVARNVMKLKRVKCVGSLDAQEAVRMKVQVSYLDLAKEAKSRGDMKGVWRAFKQHARVMRKTKKDLPWRWKTD